MQGLMMNYQLTLSPLLERAAISDMARGLAGAHFFRVSYGHVEA